MTTADVTQVDPADFERPDLLHASPPCPSFSSASRKRENAVDVALAQATARFVGALLPHFFTLENVFLYRKSRSWRLITDTLDRCGYWTQVYNCNAADFGVSQVRKRMIVRAVRGGFLPPLPSPVEWRGWYSAIEDLLPSLPDSRFAPWQMERGVLELCETTLVGAGGYDGTVVEREAGEPAFTVTANRNQVSQIKAFIVNGQNSSRALTVRQIHEPMFTVTASHDKCAVRAVIPGRIVQMTPRCLARFQSLPDSYILPDDKTLAVRVIGNAVPPLMYRRIVESLTLKI